MFFQILLYVHILTAIIAIGPTFITPILFNVAKRGGHIRFIFDLRKSLSFFPKIGDLLLFVTGAGMMVISEIYFHYGWLNLSLFFFFCMRFISSYWSPKSSIKKKLNELVSKMVDGEEVPKEYFTTLKKYTLYFYYLPQCLLVFIILLMIIKPTISFLSF